MATPTQVYNALTISNTFNILNVSAPINFSQFTDITDYTALGYTSGAGDVVKLISQVTNPVGQVCYENAGYAGADFSSPDCTISSHVAPQFNLIPYTATTIPVYGAYVFSIKVQITPNGGSAFEVDKVFYVELNEQVTPTLSLTESYNCGNATYTSLDSTNYGSPSGYSLQSIVRTHTVTPPVVSLQSNGTTPQTPVTADAQTILLGSPDNPLWNNAAYQAELSVVLTYIVGGNYTITHASTSTFEPINCDNNFCKMMCCLQTLIDKYNSFKGINNVLASDYFTKWQKGTMLFFAVMQEYQCSNPTLAVAYTTQFYLETGCDANCDCGCTDTPAPVVPTDVINGTNGADGLTAEFRVTGTLFQWKYTTDVGWTTLFDFSTIAGLNGTSFLQGSGVPSNGDGSNGDSYLNVDNGDIYLKTSGTWNLTGNIHGADGVAVIFSNAEDVPTSTTSLFTFDTATIPANTLATDGDTIWFDAAWHISNPKAAAAGQTCGLDIFGAIDNTAAGGMPALFVIKRVRVTGKITRVPSVGNDTVQVEYTQTYYTHDNTTRYPMSTITDFDKEAITGLDFTNTLDIASKGTSAGSGDLVQEFFEVVFLNK